ncbi:MAG: 5'/3'-nucleotidase SurE [Acidobacteriota bacterium]
MRILVTNDDGIFSQGIQCLADAMSEIGDVVVVAPDREQSASGHSLTLHRPLRLRKVREHWYSVDGTPTDCVNMAVQGVLKEDPPDLVVSGINYGVNMGDDVTYSGTVSAAFEANMHHLPAVAFSQEVDEGFDFERSARFAREIIEVLVAGELPADLLLNVNFPAAPCRGLRWTRLGKRHYKQTVVEKTDPMGRKYYWIAGTPHWEQEDGTDQAALASGYASMTPLHLDLTDYRGLDESAPLRDRLEHLELR